MNIRTMALIGGAVAVALANVMIACSSSGSGNPGGGNSSSGGSSSGTTTSSSSGTTTSSSSGTASSSSGSTGSSSGTTEDAACAKPPETHPSKADGGIYCPYSFNDLTDSGTQYCTTGAQQCCLSGGGDAGPSVCAPIDDSTAAFNGGLGSCGATYEAAWQCGNSADCTQAGPLLPLADGGPGVAPTGDAGALVCCLLGGSLEADTSCNGYQKTHFGGTTCQPSSLCQGSVAVVSGTKTYADPLYTTCTDTTTSTDCPTGKTCTAIFTTGTAIGVCLPQ
jgi:hypothetical protein